jgi:hypothetical protein
MKVLFFALIMFLMVGSSGFTGMEKGETRYILIEAPCKPGFKAIPESKEKVILTKVFKMEFENSFELVNAEPELVTAFEVALEKAYPGSRNQVKDILVYMLTTEKDAKELYNRKIKQFKTLETGVIELKVK